MENSNREYLTSPDFEFCPVWKYDEDSELFHPVRGGNDLPERTRDLFIGATFMTASGMRFEGYVVGVERIFSIGLFFNDCVYHLNKNIPDISRDQVKKLFTDMGVGGDSSFNSIFPINYETKWGGEVFVNFSGSIEID